MQRRLVLGRLALLAAALPAAGCGFHLRVPAALPYTRIALTGFAARSTMATEIRRALPPGSRIVASPGEAEVIIDALEDTRDTTVEASLSAGQVREQQLHVKLRYRVLRPDGKELLGQNIIERQVDLTYNESSALAKDTEQDAIYRDMQSDIAQQLMRVLTALGHPA